MNGSHVSPTHLAWLAACLLSCVPARSATLLVAPPGGPLFDDGFESGDLAPWTVIVDP